MWGKAFAAVGLRRGLDDVRPAARLWFHLAVGPAVAASLLVSWPVSRSMGTSVSALAFPPLLLPFSLCSLPQQLKGGLVQRRAVLFCQATDAIGQLALETSSRQLIHVANSR